MRDMTDYKAAHTNKKRTRLVRSAKSRGLYMEKVAAMGKHYSSLVRVNGKTVLPTLKVKNVVGKKVSEVVGVHDHTRVEMAANEKKGANRASSTDLIAAVTTATHTKRNYLDTVPV